MLNEERVILMTKLASYENNEGKKALGITRYFRGDYMVAEVIKAVLSATVAFVLIAAMYVFCNFDILAEDIYKMDLVTYGKNIIKYYCLTVIVYGIICYGVGSYRYHKAKKNLKSYAGGLKKLNALNKN